MIIPYLNARANGILVDLVYSKEARQGFEALDQFDSVSINRYWNDLAKEHGVSYNQVMPTLRYAITGRSVGASIPLTMEILGKSTCLSRLEEAASHQ